MIFALLMLVAGPAVLDTTFVRIRGGGTIRRLVEEIRIAPQADDTSLFTQIRDFKVDGVGRFWVYDQPSSSVFLFDRNGKLLRRIGRSGAGPGEFRSNSGMVTLGDSGMALWDPRNGRISLFSSSGDFLTSWTTPTNYATFNGLWTDRSGAVYLKRPVTAPREGAMLGREGLVRLGRTGAPADSMAPPDMPVPRDVYQANSPDGRARASSRSDFGPSYHWAWHPDGYFIVANGGNYEIVVAKPGQPPLAIMRESSPVAISDAEREEEKARITWGLQRTVPGWSWKGPPIVKVKAPLGGLFVSGDGRIWAMVPGPSERIPEAELDSPSDKTRPVSHFRTPLIYEVFTPEGRFLGRIPFPPRTDRIMEARGNLVWAIQRDQDDLPALVRFRVDPPLP